MAGPIDGNQTLHAKGVMLTCIPLARAAIETMHGGRNALVAVLAFMLGCVHEGNAASCEVCTTVPGECSSETVCVRTEKYCCETVCDTYNYNPTTVGWKCSI